MVSDMYVPILKSKRGEMAAIRHTYDDVMPSVIPLIEILPEYTKTKTTIYKKLKKNWRGEKILVDVSYCGDDGLNILEGIHQELSDVLRIIPVLRTSSANGVIAKAREIVSVSNEGYCLRVDISDLKDAARIQGFISTSLIDIKDIALLVDLSFVDDEETYKSSLALVENIANLSDYKSLIVASGCSPDTLTDYKVGEDNFIERLEWQYWRKYRGSLSRSSTYSDYTTQHPFVLPPGNFPGSKSIRYTIEDQVAVLRGKQSDPSDAYLEHAANLHDYTDYYSGEDFSYGDKYIKEKRDIFDAGGTNDPGNPTSWVMVRVNHHIAFVVKHDLAAIAAE